MDKVKLFAWGTLLGYVDDDRVEIDECEFQYSNFTPIESAEKAGLVASSGIVIDYAEGKISLIAQDGIISLICYMNFLFDDLYEI